MRLWAVVPAAGRGRRFGGGLPKQYVDLCGRPLIAHTLERLARHPRIAGLMVALAADDPHWPGWTELHGCPLRTCRGGGERADSVLAAIEALPADVADDDWILVHDAARPCLPAADLDRLLALGCAHPVGALLAAPLRDTLKRADAGGAVEATVPREALWRALTPQLFRRGALAAALRAARDAGVQVTDEAMAIERSGQRPLLVEGSEANLKVTTADDRALAEFLLSRMHDSGAEDI